MTVELILGDCLEVMKGMDDNSIDTIITDPPYGLEFMGKDWDKGVPGIPFWAEMLRIAKPGACLMAMGGTRTYHRLASAIEDAGWRIIDMIEWLYGSGFPKSYDIGKGMDKAQGAEREVVGHYKNPDGYTRTSKQGYKKDYVGGSIEDANRYLEGDLGRHITAPATPEAQLWDGWGTALKPAHEPICVAYKPREGTYVENALKWGVAGLWIDGGRVEYNGDDDYETSLNKCKKTNTDTGDKVFNGMSNKTALDRVEKWKEDSKKGRFPANVIHDGSDEVLREFPETAPSKPHKNKPSGTSTGIFGMGTDAAYSMFDDCGSAARFFYCAKASRSERNAGLDGIVNKHPTVKPIALMEYLVRLTRTPTGGVVLDPFMGSGTTGIACVNEGRDFIGIEQNEEYLEIARRRIEYWQKRKQPRLL